MPAAVWVVGAENYRRKSLLCEHQQRRNYFEIGSFAELDKCCQYYLSKIILEYFILVVLKLSIATLDNAPYFDEK
jgi:hypothetical protein